jgi:hypothetical protein
MFFRHNHRLGLRRRNFYSVGLLVAFFAIENHIQHYTLLQLSRVHAPKCYNFTFVSAMRLLLRMLDQGLLLHRAYTRPKFIAGFCVDFYQVSKSSLKAAARKVFQKRGLRGA